MHLAEGTLAFLKRSDPLTAQEDTVKSASQVTQTAVILRATWGKHQREFG